ncbi:MAG: cardiolipin synthase B [Gammaproteobacteria bacterium]|nr:cardiolipin synthase B [Gammaproteobacteria bacterium]
MADNKFQIYTEGDDLYQDMLDSIASAKTSIVLESYIFEADAISKSFIDALLERANTGVDVRLHLDAFGSLELALSKQINRIETSNVKLKWYNPWCWYRPFHYNHRNHRKLLVVDNAIAWLGGFNIHNENSMLEYGDNRWLDTHIKIEGPLAGEAKSLFEQLWNKLNVYSPEIDSSSESIIVTNVTWRQRRQFRQHLTSKFKAATRQLWLCTPYFMPDRFLEKQLARAAKRGVDVRLLLPHKTDRPVARWVARAAYHSLIMSGVKIYEYNPRFLHSKIMLIDDEWTTIGSTNLDYRSFFVNLEINLISYSPNLIKPLHNIYLDNLSHSEQIQLNSLVKDRWLSTIYQAIGYFCRKLL